MRRKRRGHVTLLMPKHIMIMLGSQKFLKGAICELGVSQAQPIQVASHAMSGNDFALPSFATHFHGQVALAVLVKVLDIAPAQIHGLCASTYSYKIARSSDSKPCLASRSHERMPRYKARYSSSVKSGLRSLLRPSLRSTGACSLVM